MVRKVKSDVLRSVCKTVAIENGGFLYITDQKDRINDEYAGVDETGGASVYKGKVSLEDIREELKDWVTEGKSVISHVRDENVFLINPFKIPAEAAGSNQLYTILEHVFKQHPYITEKLLKDKLSEANIKIADHDIPLFIEMLCDNEMLEELSGDTVYFKPGLDLKDNTQLPDLADELSRRAREDGTLTYTELENFVGIAPKEAVITDLTRVEQVLYEVGNKFLVNSKECIEEYLDHIIEEGLERRFEEEFRSNNYVMTDDRFERELRSRINNQSDILSDIQNQDRFLLDVKDKMASRLNLAEVKMEINGEMITLREKEEELSDFIDSEAERITDEVRREVTPENIGTMDYVVNNRAKPKLDNYGGNQTVHQYVEEKILEAVEHELDQSDLPVKGGI